MRFSRRTRCLSESVCSAEILLCALCRSLRREMREQSVGEGRTEQLQCQRRPLDVDPPREAVDGRLCFAKIVSQKAKKNWRRHGLELATDTSELLLVVLDLSEAKQRRVRRRRETSETKLLQREPLKALLLVHLPKLLDVAGRRFRLHCEMAELLLLLIAVYNQRESVQRVWERLFL